jgi:hypothetical protein
MTATRTRIIPLPMFRFRDPDGNRLYVVERPNEG